MLLSPRQTPLGFEVLAAAKSLRGKRRQENEDAYLVDCEAGLLVVADGMGGHALGEVASRLVVDTIGAFVRTTAQDKEITWPPGIDVALSETARRLIAAVLTAHRAIVKKAHQDADAFGMGSTVVAALIEGAAAHVAHVGDSRAYLVRGGEISQLTKDHSWVAERIDEGILTPEMAAQHPNRNIITRSLGMDEPPRVDTSVTPIAPGDMLLLCSDGLSGALDPEEIVGIAEESGSDLPVLAGRLVEAAMSRRGEDDTTAVVAAIRDRVAPGDTRCHS